MENYRFHVDPWFVEDYIITPNAKDPKYKDFIVRVGMTRFLHYNRYQFTPVL